MNDTHSRGVAIANLYAEAEMEKGRYVMPNEPRGCRTIFGTLATLESRRRVLGSGSGGGNGGSHRKEERLHGRRDHDNNNDVNLNNASADVDVDVDVDIDVVGVDKETAHVLSIGAEKIYQLNYEQLMKVRQRFVNGEV